MMVQLVINSSNTFFWIDETFTLLMLKDQSFSQMLDNVKDTINAIPPMYFSLIWAWSKIFGDSFLALRSFSMIFVGAVWVVLWFTLRSFFSRLATFLALLLCIYHPALKFMNTDARPYSLYCFEYLLACYFLMLSLKNERTSSHAAIAGTFVSYAMLTTTHYIGIVYTAFLLSVAVGIWFLRRSPALGRYCLAGIAGASVMLVDVPFLLIQRKLGDENNWLVRPDIAELVRLFDIPADVYVPQISLILVAFLLCTNILVMGLSTRIATEETQRAVAPDYSDPLARLFPIIPALFVSLLVPVFIWAESKVGLKLFLGRYLSPSVVLVWTFAAGFTFDTVFKYTWRNAASIRRAPACLLLALPLVVALSLVGGVMKNLVRRRDPSTHLVTARRLPQILAKRPLNFITMDMNAASFRIYSGENADQVKFLLREKRATGENAPFPNNIAAIESAVGRRFWKDYIIPQQAFAEQNAQYLMRESELATIQELIGSAAALKISENLGDNLAVVSVTRQ